MIKDLKVGKDIKLDKLSKAESKTVPPTRLSETRLVSELEKRNIGRPATYSSIVSLIQDRGYVTKKGNQLRPTPLGFAVSKILSSKLPEFTAYDYTSQMEEKLEEIIDGKENKKEFLTKFWKGKNNNGFETLITNLLKNIDFKEVEQFSKIDLHNGYSIKYSKFGIFLQDDNGKPNDKGYLPSIKLDENIDIYDYKDKELCVKTFKENSLISSENNELGVLTDGVYKGWTVSVREGKYGKFAQAISPNKKDKPINQTLPKETKLETLKLEDVEELFKEVKLPRNLSANFFVGIGKKGPWIGYKATAKSKKATFKSLPVEYNPRTVTLEEVEKVWNG